VPEGLDVLEDELELITDELVLKLLELEIELEIELTKDELETEEAIL
jgi:hypothetical protein